jgi:hypothetical protein
MFETHDKAYRTKFQRAGILIIIKRTAGCGLKGKVLKARRLENR